MQHIFNGKFWTELSEQEQKKLSQLLIVWAVAEIFAISYFIYSILFNFENSCMVCNILLTAMATLPIICVINGRIHCSVNSIFILPLVLYSFYFSDFNTGVPGSQTIYITVFWLYAGLVFLLFFSETNIKI
ncbi:MAG TPA: hypothetical protein VK872_13360, partial [Draconibacterium sp.]|nr:hypothetical protein [Draconibacterium sp.]